MPEKRPDADNDEFSERQMSVAAESTPVLELPLDTAAEPVEPPAVAAPGMLRMLLVLGSLSALGPASMDGYLPGLPGISDDFGVSASLVQVTIAVFLVGLGAGQLVAGPLSDAFGRRRPMLAAIVLYATVTLCCAAAPTIEVLIVGRFLQGATAAAGIVISRAVVRDLYAGREGARFLSRLVLIYGIAPLLAPLLGGVVLAFTDWRGVFVGMACLGLALLAVTAAWLPETLPPERRRSAAVARMLAAYGHLFRSREFIGYALALGLATGTVVAYVSASPFVLQDIYGVSPQLYGVFFGVNAGAMIAASQINAHLVGRWDPRRLLEVAGFALAGVGALLLVAVELGLGLWVVALCMLGLMACWGFIPANAISLAMTDHPEIAGSASAVLGIFQFGLAGLAAPLVGVAGATSALPMAIAILALGLTSIAAIGLMTGSSRRPAPGTFPGR